MVFAEQGEGYDLTLFIFTVSASFAVLTQPCLRNNVNDL